MGVTSVFSYLDELDPDVSAVLDDIRRQDHDEDEPLLRIAGFGRSGFLATEARIYIVRAGYLMTRRWDEAYVGTHPLGTLAEVNVDPGWFYARCTLHFLDHSEPDFFLTRPRDRDKLRLASRMLLNWADRARALAPNGQGSSAPYPDHLRTGVRVPSSQAPQAHLWPRRDASELEGAIRAPREAAAARVPSLSTTRDEEPLANLPVPDPLPGGRTGRLPVPGGNPSQSTADAVSLLRSLWDLAQSGAITTEEYAAKKADILRRV